MATHSSILVWRIPWTEEPDRLQSMGSQRVRHDWSVLACMQCHNQLFHYLRTRLDRLTSGQDGAIGPNLPSLLKQQQQKDNIGNRRQWPLRERKRVLVNNQTKWKILSSLFTCLSLQIHECIATQTPILSRQSEPHFIDDELDAKDFS